MRGEEGIKINARGVIRKGRYNKKTAANNGTVSGDFKPLNCFHPQSNLDP
jgi:hypothetical protein